MHNHRQGIDQIAVHKDWHFHEITLAIAIKRIVKAGIAAGDWFQPVIKIENNFIQRQAVNSHCPIASIGKVNLFAAPLGTKR